MSKHNIENIILCIAGQYTKRVYIIWRLLASSVFVLKQSKPPELKADLFCTCGTGEAWTFWDACGTRPPAVALNLLPGL